MLPHTSELHASRPGIRCDVILSASTLLLLLALAGKLRRVPSNNLGALVQAALQILRQAHCRIPCAGVQYSAPAQLSALLHNHDVACCFEEEWQFALLQDAVGVC